MDIDRLVDELECRLEWEKEVPEESDERFEDFYKTIKKAADKIGEGEGNVVRRAKEDLKSWWETIF